MKKNKILTIALATLLSSSIAFADNEVTGKIVIEHAGFMTSGSTIGNAGTDSIIGSGSTNNYMGVNRGTTPTNDYRTLKDAVSIRIFADGDIADGVTYHAELQGYKDDSRTGDYVGEYTQNAGIRELYVDIAAGDGWEARLGKQQIVWGTADGMKLLDIINPTDYTEMAQNQMEDARIPVWALNIESGNVQVVISEPKENVFAGLNRSTDTDVRRNNMFLDDTTLNNGTNTGNAYMMMGPDSITGVRNGFLNITPDIGSIATRFSMAFDAGVANPNTGANMGLGNLDTQMMMGFTVNIFESMTMDQMAGAMSGGQCNTYGACLPPNFAGAVTNTFNQLNGMGALPAGVTSAGDLNGQHMLAYGFAALYNSNLADVDDGLEASSTYNTAFDYMGDTTFRTFNAFVNAGSQYVYNMPDSDEVDFAIKTSQTTKSGVNYSLNFSNSFDKNPVINLSWRGENGVELITTAQTATMPGGYDTTTLFIHDGNGNYYGGAEAQAAKDAAVAAAMAGGETDPQVLGGIGYAASLTRAPTLQFEQSVVRTKNLGGSFDTTIEVANLGPVVIRGEVLYTRDGMQPVINKDLLSIGDLVGALQMKPADRFKFVLGADITVFTNMMISAQYISDRNLDFIDGNNGYTTDYATMHMSNGFNKAIKDKQFYSLFFSKPFGASGQNRWNNIFMSEEGVGENGYWNRFDADFGITDDLVATVEFNTYGGNVNTQFGQLDKSDNMQVGIKLTF